jgi:hypothetical protein
MEGSQFLQKGPTLDWTVARGWAAEGATGSGSVAPATDTETGLGFSVGQEAQAALVQDEVAYAAERAIAEAAASRSFGKDPRDLDFHDTL